MSGRFQFPKGVPVPDWPPPAAGRSSPVDLRGWNEDWRAGDLAQCHMPDSDWQNSQSFDPKHGEVLRVSKLAEGLDLSGTVIISALGFEGKPAGQFWAAKAFRKLRPVIEPAEAEFSATIRDLGRVPAEPRGR